MTGIVLCGGQSTRMGSDKGLLPQDTGNWATHAAEKLSTLDIPVLFSINPQQFPVYGELFPPEQLIIDNETFPVKGPLLGVLSSHLQLPAEDLFALACDMPFMETSLLKELYAHYLLDKKTLAYVFTNNGEPEPLCAIYTTKGLSFIYQMLLDGTLTRHSMKFMLDQLPVHRIPIPESQQSCFRNINAHADLNGH